MSTSTSSTNTSTLTSTMLESMLDHPLFKTPAPPQFKFVENTNLTIPGPVDVIRRTWKQRLFTLPWRPLKTHLRLQTYIPDPNYYVIHNQTVVAHPVTISKLKKALLDSSAKPLDVILPLKLSDQLYYDPFRNLANLYWNKVNDIR